MDSIIIYTLLASFCVGLLAFVVIYFRSNWRENIVGRYVMYFWLTLLVVFFYILFGRLLGNYYGRSVVNTLILIAMNYGAWKLTWLLYKVQNGKDKDEST
jgi:hypothetical protein